jgi:hypothetical protein
VVEAVEMLGHPDCHRRLHPRRDLSRGLPSQLAQKKTVQKNVLLAAHT